MVEYTYWSPLYTTPLAFYWILGIVLLLAGLGCLASEKKHVRTLGVAMLACVGATVALCWSVLYAADSRYGVESQVKSRRPIGQLASVTRSTQKTFLIEVEGKQRVLEGRSGDLQAGESLIEERRGNGGIAVCRATEDATPRCWWQIVLPLGQQGRSE